MKMLAKLEKNKSFWYLLATSLAFFLLRLPSLIEPNWYGDEGIYQVMGQALDKGRLLYSQIWDNKPPLLYLTYALFHGDQFQVRLFALIIGLLTLWVFFYLSQLLFRQLKASIISTICFALLFATPFLEGNIANAENFMLLPIITAGLLIYAHSENIKYKILNTNYLILLSAGLLLGISFLFKIVAVFDLAAFCVYLFIVSFTELRWKGNNIIKWISAAIAWIRNDALLVLIGFMFPIGLTFLYFISKNTLHDFTQAVFSSNVGYVGYGNMLIIPQGFLILKLILLALASFLIFWKRKQLSKSTIFIIIWLSFSLFNTFFSGRPYTHYLLVSIPSFCLLIGLFFTEIKTKIKITYLLLLIGTALLLIATFKPNIKKPFQYYDNSISFLAGQKSVNSYQSFFDQKTPRDYEVATFIKTHTNPQDYVFIWGDSAQIYALSDKLPPGKYTVAYHINQYKSGLQETQAALNTVKPKYIVALSEAPAIPFYLPTYVSEFIFKGATVYERSF